MEDTHRALVILTASVLLLAPLTNGILDAAAQTADRLFLRDAELEIEPPFAPPDAEPPEDLEPNEGEDEFEGEGEGPGPGGVPPCELTPQPVAQWYHPPVNDLGPAVGNRVNDPTTVTFEIEEHHVGLGLRINVTNVYGPISAYVYPEGDRDSAVWFVDRPPQVGDDVVDDSATPRSQLTVGTWVAELNYRSATYDSLVFDVFLAACAGVPS